MIFTNFVYLCPKDTMYKCIHYKINAQPNF